MGSRRSPGCRRRAGLALALAAAAFVLSVLAAAPASAHHDRWLRGGVTTAHAGNLNGLEIEMGLGGTNVSFSSGFRGQVGVTFLGVPASVTNLRACAGGSAPTINSVRGYPPIRRAWIRLCHDGDFYEDWELTIRLDRPSSNGWFGGDNRYTFDPITVRAQNTHSTLALSDNSISENGGEATVTATLSQPQGTPVTITVGTTPFADTGMQASDYTLSSPGTLTIAAGSTTSTGTVTITAVDNAATAAAKTMRISGTVAGGDGVGVRPPASLFLRITDDETSASATPTLALSSSSIAEAGGVATVTATLDQTVSVQVRVWVYAAAGAGAFPGGFNLSSAGPLTFAAGATASTGTVTITAVDDDVYTSGRTVRVFGQARGGNTANPADVTLTLTDDETLPTATLELSSSSIAEAGGETTVTATLSSGSSEATVLTVSASPGSGTDFTVSSADTLTIAAGATTSTGTVTITATADTTDSPDKQVAVSAAATGGNGVVAPVDVTLTITDDDDPPDVTLSLSAASVSEMGGTSLVSAVLSRPSSAVTTVTVTGVSGAYTVPSTPADRRIEIAAGDTTSTDTVTVIAVDNDVDEPNRTSTVTATMANSQGTGSVTGVTLTLTDDETTPTVTLSAATASISENGGTSAISATLSGKSSEATTVTVTAAVGAAYSVASGAGATIVLAVGATTSADTVTVTAVNNDVDAADNAVTVTGTAANGHGVGAVTGASLTITDDDTAGLAVAPATSTSSRLRTTEAGGTAEFTVALTSQPTGDVSVSVSSSDTAQGTVSPSPLTFTASSWATEQTVTLTGVDDDHPVNNPGGTIDGSQTWTVTLTSSSTVDAPYNGLAQVTVYAINLDDELGLSVGAVTGQATEAGGQSTFTVALLTQPSEAVTVAVSSLDSSEGRVSPSSLTFGTSNWNVNQTVTVTGLNDDVDDGDVAWAVRLDPSSGDADYNAASVVVDVSVTTTDDDTAALVVSPTPSSTSRLRTTEAGGQAAFTVRLATEPVGNVVLDVASALAAEGTVSASSLTFTASNWATAQTVTLTGADDEVDDGDRDYTATLTVNQGSTADSVYDALALVTVYGTNADDDEAGVTVSPQTSTTSRLRTGEDGAQATFTVQLDSEPTGDVVLDVASSDTDEGTVDTDPVMNGDQSTLTFTASSWNSAQTVTLTGVDDSPGTTDGPQDYTVTLEVDQANTADATYDALPDVTVYAVNVDDEVTPDVNGDGDVDYQDALLMYYTYTAPILGDAEFGPELRRILFRNLRGGRDDDDAGYLAILTAAGDWEAAAAGDLNLDGDMDYQDALLMYYTYTAPILGDAQFGPELRRILFRNLRGGRTDDADGYLAILDAAKALVTAYGSGP